MLNYTKNQCRYDKNVFLNALTALGALCWEPFSQFLKGLKGSTEGWALGGAMFNMPGSSNIDSPIQKDEWIPKLFGVLLFLSDSSLYFLGQNLWGYSQINYIFPDCTSSDFIIASWGSASLLDER